MIERGAFAGARVMVAGLGVSGRAAARVLAEEGASVLVSEAAQGEDPGDELERLGVEMRVGGHHPDHLEGATLVILSPGVPPAAPVIGWARDRGVPIWSELELGARLCRIPYVAVTGTNGKTTTVEMVAAMMRADGLAATACGNVGFPFSLAAREPFEALAVEASSFQLASSESLRPRVSVLLNLAPDHLDWHQSYPAYVRAKARIFLRQGEDDVHVGNRDDAEAARVSRQAPCRQRWFGWGRPIDGDVGLIDGRVVDGAGQDLGRPLGQGRAFAMDAAAAVAASLSFGLSPEAVRSVVESFDRLAHRGVAVGTAAGITFIDNSKATNPHAALAALDGLTGAVLIAGGLAKGVDLSPLAAAAPSLSGVVAIGEAAPAVADVFEGLVPVSRAGSMEEAVAAAFHLAPPGGTVVLAPACASQDMFRDYRERGHRFASAAAALAARIEGSRGRAHAR
jgi:UDP-N-acetylmuramoylalanine--D-glutamate ligase